MQKKKVLFEDMTMVANKWSAGISNRELSPRKMSLHDVVDAYNKSQTAAASTPNHPFPMDELAKDLGDLFLLTDQIQTKLSMARENPLVNEDETSVEYIDDLVSKFEKIKNFIIRTGHDLDKKVK